MEEPQAITVIETALLCAEGSMTVAAMQKLFEPDLVPAQEVKSWLESIQIAWQDRGLELVETAAGWRFQSRTAMQRYLERLSPEQTPKYSRAVLETLAIIAWKQPVTRGDIEAIRGVTVSSQIIKTLEDRGWIEAIGYRDGPGRPALLGTTKQFLDDLGLRALDELPPLVPIEQDAPSGAELALGMVEQVATIQNEDSVKSLETNDQLSGQLEEGASESHQNVAANELDSNGNILSESVEQKIQPQSEYESSETDSANDLAEAVVNEVVLPQQQFDPAGQGTSASVNEYGRRPTESFESEDEKEHNNRSVE